MLQKVKPATEANYLCAKGKFSTNVSTEMMTRFINPLTRTLKRDQFARQTFHNKYDSLFHPQLGRMVALKSIQINTIGASSTQLENIKVQCDYEAYFFKPYEKGVADVVVKSVNSKVIVADLLGYSVEIRSSDVFP